MSGPFTSDQVRVTTVVPADPATAFEVFTSQVDLWWRRGPRFRQGLGRPSEMRFEGEAGGRLAFGGRRQQQVEGLPGARQIGERPALGAAGGGVLRGAHRVAIDHHGLERRREQVRGARALAGEGARGLAGHHAMLRHHQSAPALRRLPFAHDRAGGAQRAGGGLEVAAVGRIDLVPPWRPAEADAQAALGRARRLAWALMQQD